MIAAVAVTLIVTLGEGIGSFFYSTKAIEPH